MREKVIKVISFCAILVGISYCLTNVLCFKYGDGILQMEYFYKERPGSIDVICLGSSHTFININTKTLWDEFGIASYDLAGSVQPFWNSYYFLKEALLYQKPKLVILDVFRAVEKREYIDHSRVIKNTFGISSFYHRVFAIWKSAPKSQRMHYWLAYPTYHRRYAEISKADFQPNDLRVYSKGFGISTKTTALKTPQIGMSSKSSPVSEKTEEYLLKIIELCNEYHIPLLLCVTPYAGDSMNDEAYYVTVQNIAQEKGISYINFNHHYEQMALDFSFDAVDTSHLNYKGNEKFSRYLGQYIKRHYNIPDHRGEEGWASYDTMSRMFQWRIENYEVSKTKELSAFLDKIKVHQDRYLLVIGLQGNYKAGLAEASIREKLEELGVFIEDENKNDVWVIDDGKIVFHAGKEACFDWHMRENHGFVRVSCDRSGSLIKCNINREEETFIPHGLSIVVYDRNDYHPAMNHIIDRAGFSLQDGKFGLKQALQRNAT